MHPNRRLGFGKANSEINKKRFQKCDWTEFYRDPEEAIQGNMPVARGKFISTHCFVDTNYAGNTKMRLSQTGILFFCNSVPIIWFRKKQNSVEASKSGSEFTSMKNTVEIIEALQYKLRMFGVTIDG